MSRLPVGLVALASVLSLCGAVRAQATTSSAPASQPTTSPADLAAQLYRAPWRPDGGYLRRWLICGVFPNPPHASQPFYDHTPPYTGMETDYLAASGGEAAAAPQPGQAVRRPDGSTATWTAVDSPAPVVDLRKALADQNSENAVAYAYTTFDWPADGPAVLALGSDDGIAAWLNGQRVHFNVLDRTVRPDADLVEVMLRKGRNALLLKVENGRGGFAFTCRLVDPRALSRDLLTPVIASDRDGELVIQLDQPLWARMPDQLPVEVILVAPGGAQLVAAAGLRGRRVPLAIAHCPDGPYEVRCTWTGSDGRPRAAHLPWFKGDLLAAARRLVAEGRAATQPAPATQPAERIGQEHLAFLADLVQDRVGGPLDGLERIPERAFKGVHSALMEAAERRLGPAASRQPYGFSRLAYVDPVDDSVQFCRVYWPLDYDPHAPQRWPVVVMLHGYNPRNPPYVGWWAVDQRHSEWADRYGVIVVEPHGRGNSWYRGIGEADVLRCLEAVAPDVVAREVAPGPATAPQDGPRRRVLLMGYSMGGHGAWMVGTRHPGLFAALAPIYGGWDYRVLLSPAAVSALSPDQRLGNEKWSSFAQAESLLTTPVFINHGDADPLVNVEHSRYAARLLERWGYDVRYWEHPGGDHGGLGCEDAILQWFLARPPASPPRHVRLRAGELKSAAAHWLRVTQRDDPAAFITAEADVLGPNAIRLETANAAEVVLDLGVVPGLDASQPVQVTWNGDVRSGQPGRTLTLRRADYEPGPRSKTPRREGPLADVQNTPFIIVTGTTATDAAMRQACAERAQAVADAWFKWQHVRPRVARDVDLQSDPQRLAAYSLVLIGGPAENAVTAALARDLPLQIAGDQVTVDGRTFTAPNACVRMAYPHPLNPGRYVEVQAATAPAALAFVDSVNDGLDWAIVDARVDERAEDSERAKAHVAGGTFTREWRRDDRWTTVRK